MKRRVRQLVVLAVILFGISLAGSRRPEVYWGVVASLGLSAPWVVRGWRAARGTALRAAVVWSGIAWGLGMVSVLMGGQATGGYWSYLTSLATLAALISVLGARTPGGGAWAILMVLLLVVFLIPWLEGPGLGLGRGKVDLSMLRLDPPWSLFFVVLAVTGVTNYLPTRYGFSALCLAFGFAFESYGLTRPDLPGSTRSVCLLFLPWSLSAVLILAGIASGRTPRASSRLEAGWLWFRDHWGVVWALRVQERFNRSAETQKWPIRLAWHGVVGENPELIPDGAEATFLTLIRRFVTPERFAEVSTRFRV